MGEEDINKKLLIKDEDEREQDLSLQRRVWNESKKMWVVAGPAIFTRFSTFGTNVVSQAFVGHIGSTELAAYSLVFTVLIRFANGILLGMASALETLCGQSFGAKQYNMLGVHLQRSWIVLFLSTFFLVPLCIFTTPILEALGQEENIAQVAGYISLWTIPMIFAFVLSFTCQMFLQAQSKNMIIAYLSAFSIAIHILLSWLLTVKYQFGIPGAMVSTILAFWIPNIGQLLFVICGGCPQTWQGFSTLAFKDLSGVIKLSLSSGVMLCLELWDNTVLVLLTGHMENAEFERQWVGNDDIPWLLGCSKCSQGGSSKGATFSIVVIVFTSFSIGLVLFFIFLFLRERLAYIFTNNEEVAKAVADLSPLLAFSILLNSVQPVLSGIVDIFALGAGWQNTVAYVNMACYYLVGIPVGVVLGYVVNLQVKGVWIGMLFGTFVQTIVLLILTCRTDWDNQVTIARNRVRKWAVKDIGDSNAVS
ncbi:protein DETOXIFICATION 21-like [Argentina anserina]|uniref:protein DETOXIFICATION 21-like n=1 Tax=Argentina anserina TaxID=57926 RepID=UPI00217645E4|nr:protein DETOXIFICATION 21-like [Potentilla anserina]